MRNPYVLPAIVVVTLATVAIGFYGLRSPGPPRTSWSPPGWSARPGTRPRSAASTCPPPVFLGVAGLILKHGVDVLWYPVGFAAGYLALLLFVAAPLRRSGAFTLPDFCELRLRLPAAAQARHRRS